MHCAGPTATDIFATFTFRGDDEKENYKHVLRKFAAYCEPKQNELFETYRLPHRQRVPGEPLESWIKDLHVILKGCNYAHQPTDDRMLRDMIVFNIDDELLREKLMHEGSELTLDRCIEICCTAELTKPQARAMSSISSTPAIDAVKAKTTTGTLQPCTGRQILIVHTAVFAPLPAIVQLMDKPAITTGAATTLLRSVGKLNFKPITFSLKIWLRLHHFSYPQSIIRTTRCMRH